MGKLIERKSGSLRRSLPRTNSLASEMLKRKRHARDASSIVKEVPQDVSPAIPTTISPVAGSKVEDDEDSIDVGGPIFQVVLGIITIVAIPIFLGVDVYRTIRKNIRNKDHEKTGNPEAASKQLESQVVRADSPDQFAGLVYIDQYGDRGSIDEAGNKILLPSLESQHAEVYDEGEASINERQPVAEEGEGEVSDLPSNSTIERLRVLEHAEKKTRALKLTLKTEVLSLPNEGRNNSINPANAASENMEKANGES